MFFPNLLLVLLLKHNEFYRLKVFADFSDDIPAVLNYFTSSTEEQIIDFYKQNFGESILQERKRDRLTLTYQKEEQTIRVVISQQNNKRQVDIIVEETQR